MSDTKMLTGKVTSVKHWTPDGLFSFKMERPLGFQFEAGQFVMIGLPDENGKPIMRAYSIVSPEWSKELEFLSIKVADGPLTSRLQKIKPGDDIILGKKPTGTLVHSALTPGKNLFLIGTGTGLAPWMSIIRDPSTYEKYEHVYVCHGVRHTDELAYREYLEKGIFEETIPDPETGEVYKLTDFLGIEDAEDFKRRLKYYPTVTREAFHHQGRLTDLIKSGKLFADLGLDQTQFNPETDRVMVCGNLEMNKEMEAICESQGMTQGSINEPGAFVDEKAFNAPTVKPAAKVTSIANKAAIAPSTHVAEK